MLTLHSLLQVMFTEKHRVAEHTALTMATGPDISTDVRTTDLNIMLGS